MINTAYLNFAVVDRLKTDFEARELHSLKLASVLDSAVYERIIRQVRQLNFTHTRIPDRYSFSAARIPVALARAFSEGEFKRFIDHLLPRPSERIHLTLRKFIHRDYTLLHDEKQPHSGYRFLLFMGGEAWEPTFGGNAVYLTEQGTGKSFVFTPQPNTLVLVEAGVDVNDFIQYVNHRAGKNSFYVLEGFLY